MRRIVLVLLLLAAWRVEAQTSPTCPYYAVNSSNAYSCFKTLAQAEAFLRADPDGTHPTRSLLEQYGADPSNNPQDADETRITYRVKPKPGTVGQRGYLAHNITGASTAYLLCGCDTSGSSGTCVAYGSMSNCTNQPALCIYNNYCNSKDTLKGVITNYFNAQPGNSGATVTAVGVEPASPLGYSNGVPDQRPIYPPNTGTLRYYGGSDSTYVGEILRVDYTNNGSPKSGSFYDYIVAPLTCPAGFNISPGTPPLSSEACTSGESGYIMVYRVPAITPPPKCPSGDSCTYGNPVVPATGAKLQTPTGWSKDAMLGLTLSYNSLAPNRTYEILGEGWSSLLSARLLGSSWDGANYTYADELGNWEIFSYISTGGFRAINSSGKTFGVTSSTPCERTVFEGGRRLIFNCGFARDSHLLRVEYPANPSQNLTVTWSATETFDGNGIQTGFYNVPVAVTRADGRQVFLSYTRINTDPSCESGPNPYVCNAVRLTALTDSAGGITLFDYNSEGRLWLLTYPDGMRERFVYGSPGDICPTTMPGACDAAADPQVSGGLLTGLYEETPSGTPGQYVSKRYGIYQYDNYNRAIVTTHPGDAGRTEFRYSANGTPTVRLFTDSTHFYERTLGSKRVGVYDKPTTITDKDSTGNVLRATTASVYGTGGYISQSYDFLGSRTDSTFNQAGLSTQSVEAANDTTGKRRTIQNDWDAANNRLAIERRVYDSSSAVPGVLKSRVTWTHNSRGQVLTSTQTDPVTNATRTTTTTYCEQTGIDAGTCPLLGLVTSVDGPRTDVSDITTYTYYLSDDVSCATQPTTCPHRKGDLWKVTNALGQVTEILRYNGMGRVMSVQDANGVITDLGYHPRGWLTSRKVRGTDGSTEADDAITRFDYWPTGLVRKVTQPDGAYTWFLYDDAHRLIRVADNFNNRIDYTLDMAGNRLQENTRDTGGVLLRTLSRVYNQLSQLETARDAYQHPTGLAYDPNGNTDSVTDALGRVTDNDYDPLNRLAKTIQDVGGINATTQFQYDARDNLTQVTDPKGLNTGYQYNGLNDLTQLTSPDTGITSYTYDSGGNRKTQIDARGSNATYSYDALNRLTGITYPNSVHNVTYSYDQTRDYCTGDEIFTKGRLAKMVDGSGNTQYCYDRFGNLVRKVQTTYTKVFTVRYAYTKAGRVNGVIYPDGTTVDYVRNELGHIVEIGSTRAGSPRQVLLSQATYYPLGPVAEWVYGNGRLMQRSLNQNYQPGLVEDGSPTGISLGYEFDEVGNLVKVRNADQSDPPRRLFGYDTLNRLTETKDGTTLGVLQAYSYDETGNRLSATAGATTTYTYPATSHRLSQVGTVARTYDPAGNLLSIGGTARQYNYGDPGRLSNFYLNGVLSQSYRYNARGERVHKYVGTTNFYTTYDEAGHWLGDYDGNGTAIQQAIWLDDLPVGLLIGAGVNQKLHYVEPDALGSPRVVIDPVRDVAVWNWDIAGEAFGNTAPNQDPDGDGTSVIFHMRFPGQRFDAVSGLNYNYFRDYEAGSGRYIQSDPIGLGGGISTYGYALGQPTQLYDKYGLSAAVGTQVILGAITGCAGGCLGASVGDYASCVAKKRLAGGKTLGQCSDECTPNPCDALKSCVSGCIAGAIIGGITAGRGAVLSPAAGFILNQYFRFLFSPDFCEKYGIPAPPKPTPMPLPDWLYDL